MEEELRSSVGGEMRSRGSIVLFFFKRKTAYELRLSLVGSEMCNRDSARAVLNSLLMTCPFRSRLRL